MKKQTMVELMESEGYQPGAPSWESEQIDRDVCNQVTCHICGHNGMLYRSYTKQLSTRLSYRAFAVCPACGNTQEF